jgi:putative ABC transport system ATP-binding protein
MNPILELEKVSKDYGDVHAVRDVSFAVNPGESLAIVGPSGSGKSSLLNLMGTLDRPTTGVVRLHGHDVAALSDVRLAAVRARWIGFIFQQFFLTGHLSAVDNVATGLLYHGVRRRDRRRRAVEALRRVGLGHRLEHRPSEMSGGEQQRVAIARAIVGEPAFLLADEPTGNLDQASGAQIVQILHGLGEDGAAVVVITHDPAVAAALPRRVEILDGRVQLDTAIPVAGRPDSDARVPADSNAGVIR